MQLFIAIGVLILVLASINFMNLSTAMATLRSKEVGVRKVLGANRLTLVGQFLVESVMVSLMAGCIALLFLVLLFPFFEELIGQELTIRWDGRGVLMIAGIILVTGLLSGSYPALMLSSYHAVQVLKGKIVNTSVDRRFRQGLVAFQFASSLVLIIAVSVVYQQLQFVHTKDLGYNPDFIINFDTQGMNGERQQAFLEEAKMLPGVEGASGISHALFGAQKSGANITWTGKDPEQEVWFEWGYVGYGMLDMLDIPVHQGRFFSNGYGTESGKVVINEATQRAMDMDNPIGEKLTVGETDYEIIGVAEDFHFQSLHERIMPTFFLLNNGWSMRIAVKLAPMNIPATLSKVEALYAKFNPGFSFDFSFHDQDRIIRYETEHRLSNMAGWAASLAVLISCMGLYGLTSFVARRKERELGIRKVLGASFQALTGTISYEFLLPLGVASALGTVTSLLMVNRWLDRFAYHVAVQWWVVVLGVALLLFFALLTVGAQIFKVVTANPVDSIRDE